MNISYKWLKEYVDFDMTAEEVGKALTSMGLEVEAVEEVQSIKGGLQGLVVGQVLTCEPHPNSDHMHVTTVDEGNGVVDREMENFMRVASQTDDSVMWLDDETIVGKEGKRVEIMGGAFEGVVGVIRRVKRCKRVVVELEGIASVAIAYVPAGLLKEIG